MKRQIRIQSHRALVAVIAWAMVSWLVLSGDFLVATPARAQGVGGEGVPRVVPIGQPVPPGLSRPVQSLARMTPRQASQPPVNVNPRQPGGYVPAAALPGRPPIIQPPGTGPLLTPSVLTSFEGISQATGGSGVPPDTVGDVSPSHYIQMVNSSFAIFDKNGVRLAGPLAINSLWTDGTVCQTTNPGDPIVLYDRAANRWMMTQFAHNSDANGPIPPYFQCIAVSETPNPLGQWYTYSFNTTSTASFNDYGKFGVWPDGYYMGANEGGFTAYVFDRVNMLAGTAARPLQRVNLPGQNMMLPSDLDGPAAPPAGAPNYFYTMKAGNLIEVWAFSVNWAIPANSTFVQVADLTSAVGFGFDVCPAAPANPDSMDCIPQPGTNQALDAIGEWPMFRFQYRNLGSRESLVGNFTVDVNPSPSADHAAIHWFELRRVGAGNWAIHNEGNYAPDASHRWIGSAAMDKSGNIAIGYSVSNGSAVFPSIRYAARLATEPRGVMGNEVTLHAGTASQTDANRWGDYSAMSVDPVDDCTFWFTSEYVANSAEGWRTRIGSFKIPTCGSTPSSFLVRLPLVRKDNPPPPRDAVINGGFEQGAGTGWRSSSTTGQTIIRQFTAPAAHGGSWAAALGGVDNETAVISQTVTVPAGSPSLSFWHWIVSDDDCGIDFGSVQINGTDVDTIDLCTTANTNSWVRRTVGLSAYAGQTVVLRFQVTTDPNNISRMYVDDVSLPRP